MTLLVACGLRREATLLARPGWVVVAGGGDAARLEQALEAAVTGATAVLSCGVAGALDPALRAGDVVVGTLHYRHAGLDPASTAPQAKPELVERWAPEQVRGDELVEWLAEKLPSAHHGTIVGADSIIATPADKAALHASTGAIAVDMESHIAARVAARHALPFGVLRTISDTAAHALPPAALDGMKPDGGVALGAILASLAKNPAQLPALIRTGRDASLAFGALSRAVALLPERGACNRQE